MSTRENDDPATLAWGCEQLELAQKWLQPFRMADPFNGDVEVDGYLSLMPDHRYGALVVGHVGGEPARQVVPATPKLHYPFDKDGSFHFPPIRRITFYDKLDGTNVLAYRYRGAGGEWLYSYKLRLAPFLRNGRFGDFLDLWREMLGQHPGLAELVQVNHCHVSCEMYGGRNVHLIEYDHPLSVAALFGVRADFSVVAPHDLDLRGVPSATRIGDLVAGQDPVARYQALREELERTNKPGEGERIVGTEGAVWYAESPDGEVSLWKCKPESVEAIHWAAGINMTAVIATCHNVLETADELTFETLKPLLLEEYDEHEIDGFREHIDRAIQQVKAQILFEAQVMAAYRALGMDIHQDKGAVMRALARQFDRGAMRKVHGTIMRHVPAP